MPERAAIGCAGVVCERPLAATGSRLSPIGRVLEDGQGRAKAVGEPLGRAGPNRAAPSARAPAARPPEPGAEPGAEPGPAATMRWLRALLKNASLAGAPKYIEHFSKFSPSPLSMKQFLDFGAERAAGWGGGRAALAQKGGCPRRR